MFFFFGISLSAAIASYGAGAAHARRKCAPSPPPPLTEAQRLQRLAAPFRSYFLLKQSESWYEGPPCDSTQTETQSKAASCSLKPPDVIARRLCKSEAAWDEGLYPRAPEPETCRRSCEFTVSHDVLVVCLLVWHRQRGCFSHQSCLCCFVLLRCPPRRMRLLTPPPLPFQRDSDCELCEWLVKRRCPDRD